METFQRPTISLGAPKSAPISFGQFGNMPPFSPAEMAFLQPQGPLGPPVPGFHGEGDPGGNYSGDPSPRLNPFGFPEGGQIWNPYEMFY